MNKKLLLAMLLLPCMVRADPIPISACLIQGTIFQSNESVNWMTENHPSFLAKWDQTNDTLILEEFDIPQFVKEGIASLTFFTFNEFFVKGKDILLNPPDQFSGYLINFALLDHDKITGLGIYSLDETTHILVLSLALFISSIWIIKSKRR